MGVSSINTRRHEPGKPASRLAVDNANSMGRETDRSVLWCLLSVILFALVASNVRADFLGGPVANPALHLPIVLSTDDQLDDGDDVDTHTFTVAGGGPVFLLLQPLGDANGSIDSHARLDLRAAIRFQQQGPIWLPPTTLITIDDEPAGLPESVSSLRLQLPIGHGQFSSINGTVSVRIDSVTAGNERQRYRLTISNLPIASAALEIDLGSSGDPAHLGEFVVDEESSRTITLGNTGNAPLHIEDVRIDGPVADFFELEGLSQALDSGGILPGDAIDLTLVANPDELGAIAATIRVFSDDPEQAEMALDLVAEATLPPPRIYVSDKGGGLMLHYEEDRGWTHNILRKTRLGDNRDMWVKISNTGHSTLQLSGYSIESRRHNGQTIPGATDFSVTAAPIELEPGEESEQIVVTFEPSGDGYRGAGLHIESNDPSMPNLVVKVGCTAVESEPAVTLPEDGTQSIVVWGDNQHGQRDVPEPNLGFVSVAAGYDHVVGLKANGSVAAWGQNAHLSCEVPAPNSDFVAMSAGDDGSLGLKTDGSVVAWGRPDEWESNAPDLTSGFVGVSSGWLLAMGLRADGSIASWGGWSFDVRNVPAPNSGFVDVAAGFHHALALRADGSIEAWGLNDEGQCNVPEPNSGFVAIDAGYRFSLGLKSNGSIVAWGSNNNGKTNVPEPNTGFVKISAGLGHALGLKNDGSIVAWGLNNKGQCNVPQPNIGFIDVAAGGLFSAAVAVDSDLDAVADFRDNCVDIPNEDQGDADTDGLGDACDSCTDGDGDGFGDPGFENDGCATDNCPDVANPDQADFDGDGLGDACDNDDDGDGVLDIVDNCPEAASLNLADQDEDGLGDVCDVDMDGDEVPNDVDNCPNIFNPDQVDADLDGIGDVCSVDTDADGVSDGIDNCVDVTNTDQADLDGDSLGDACDEDVDGDGIPNAEDNCPLVPTQELTDSDGDGIGDACDDDRDGDDIDDEVDNCPGEANGDQTDTDDDDFGDACDICPESADHDDRDGNGVPDCLENGVDTDPAPPGTGDDPPRDDGPPAGGVIDCSNAMCGTGCALPMMLGLALVSGRARRRR